MQNKVAGLERQIYNLCSSTLALQTQVSSLADLADVRMEIIKDHKKVCNEQAQVIADLQSRLEKTVERAAGGLEAAVKAINSRTNSYNFDLMAKTYSHLSFLSSFQEHAPSLYQFLECLLLRLLTSDTKRTDHKNNEILFHAALANIFAWLQI